MKLAVDTNAIIAALIKDSAARAIILSNKHELLSVLFTQSEIKKYESTIIKKTNLSKEEYCEIFEKLFNKIRMLDETEIKTEFLQEAFQTMKNIDKKDTPFLALALQEKSSIWSDDKGFKKQKKAKAYTTSQLAKGL